MLKYRRLYLRSWNGNKINGQKKRGKYVESSAKRVRMPPRGMDNDVLQAIYTSKKNGFASTDSKSSAIPNHRRVGRELIHIKLNKIPKGGLYFQELASVLMADSQIGVVCCIEAQCALCGYHRREMHVSRVVLILWEYADLRLPNAVGTDSPSCSTRSISDTNTG